MLKTMFFCHPQPPGVSGNLRKRFTELTGWGFPVYWVSGQYPARLYKYAHQAGLLFLCGRRESVVLWHFYAQPWL